MKGLLIFKRHLGWQMKDRYHELTITLNSDLVEFVADYIATIADEALELGEGKIILRSEADLTYVKEALVSLADTLGGDIQMHFELEEKANKDWMQSYRDSIEPIEAGKFYIFPSWYEPKEGLINIKIDPALAFGSGHHATTFSCLGAISKYVKEGDYIIDVGTGSGILGLACKKLGASVDLCDTDPISVKSTQENFALNHEKYDRLWEGSVDNANREYDVVIANIIADVLRFIATELQSATKKGGYLILSGILDKKEESVKASFDKMQLQERILKDEWVTLIYKK